MFRELAFELPLAATAVGSMINGVVPSPRLVEWPDDLRIRPDQADIPPTLPLEPGAALEEFIILPIRGEKIVMFE